MTLFKRLYTYHCSYHFEPNTLLDVPFLHAPEKGYTQYDRSIKAHNTTHARELLLSYYTLPLGPALKIDSITKGLQNDI
jgi:hypothetical protein